MTDEEVIKIANEKKASSFAFYFDDAFQMYIDNKIDDYQLNLYLKICGSKELRDDFWRLHPYNKKKYFAHKKTDIYIHNNGYQIVTNEIYNREYFHYLAENARKSDKATTFFVDYVKKFTHFKSYCFDSKDKVKEHLEYADLNLFFYSLQFIYLKHFPLLFKKTKTLENLCNEMSFKTLYDLLTYLFRTEPKQYPNEIKTVNGFKVSVPVEDKIYEQRKEVFDFIKIIFDIELRQYDLYFYLLIESYLSFLGDYLRINKLKFKIGIFKNKDVYEDIIGSENETGVNLYKKYLQIDKKYSFYVINEMIETVKEFPQILDFNNVNGYHSIYDLVIKHE